MTAPNESPTASPAAVSPQGVIVQSLRSAIRYLQRPDQPSLLAQWHAQELAHIADQLERSHSDPEFPPGRTLNI